MHIRLLPVIGLVLLAGLLGGPDASAHDYEIAGLAIGHPWARETPATARAGAAYLTIDNRGGTADRLVRVEVEAGVAGRAELHGHEMDEEGVMRMRPVEAIEVPAGGTAALEPGGLHIMLMNLERQLVEGESFPLTLIFEEAGSIEVEVAVEPITGPAGDDHDH